MAVPKDMLDLALHIVETKRGDFDPAKFEDQYEDAGARKRADQGARSDRPRLKHAIDPGSEALMGLSDALKRIFGGSTGGLPADERQLAGRSEGALGASLQKLPSDERGWIMMAEAAALFSHEEGQYAFGEMDDDGRNRLATFAADNRCTPDFRPTESRIYFKKS